MLKVESHQLGLFLYHARKDANMTGQRLGQFLVNTLFEEGDPPMPSIFYSTDDAFVQEWFLANCVDGD